PQSLAPVDRDELRWRCQHLYDHRVPRRLRERGMNRQAIAVARHPVDLHREAAGALGPCKHREEESAATLARGHLAETGLLVVGPHDELGAALVCRLLRLAVIHERDE